MSSNDKNSIVKFKHSSDHLWRKALNFNAQQNQMNSLSVTIIPVVGTTQQASPRMASNGHYPSNQILSSESEIQDFRLKNQLNSVNKMKQNQSNVHHEPLERTNNSQPNCTAQQIFNNYNINNSKTIHPIHHPASEFQSYNEVFIASKLNYQRYPYQQNANDQNNLMNFHGSSTTAANIYPTTVPQQTFRRAYSQPCFNQQHTQPPPRYNEINVQQNFQRTLNHANQFKQLQCFTKQPTQPPQATVISHEQIVQFSPFSIHSNELNTQLQRSTVINDKQIVQNPPPLIHSNELPSFIAPSTQSPKATVINDKQIVQESPLKLNLKKIKPMTKVIEQWCIEPSTSDSTGSNPRITETNGIQQKQLPKATESSNQQIVSDPIVIQKPQPLIVTESSKEEHQSTIEKTATETPNNVQNQSALCQLITMNDKETQPPKPTVPITKQILQNPTTLILKTPTKRRTPVESNFSNLRKARNDMQKEKHRIAYLEAERKMIACKQVLADFMKTGQTSELQSGISRATNQIVIDDDNNNKDDNQDINNKKSDSILPEMPKLTPIPSNYQQPPLLQIQSPTMMPNFTLMPTNHQQSPSLHIQNAKIYFISNDNDNVSKVNKTKEIKSEQKYKPSIDLTESSDDEDSFGRLKNINRFKKRLDLFDLTESSDDNDDEDIGTKRSKNINSENVVLDCQQCHHILTSEPENAGVFCDTCQGWQHLKCIVVDDQVGNDKWNCALCLKNKSSSNVGSCVANNALSSEDRTTFNKAAVEFVIATMSMLTTPGPIKRNATRSKSMDENRLNINLHRHPMHFAINNGPQQDSTNINNQTDFIHGSTPIPTSAIETLTNTSKPEVSQLTRTQNNIMTTLQTNQWTVPNSNIPNKQIPCPLLTRIPTAGDKRKKMLQLYCGKRNRLSTDTSNFSLKLLSSLENDKNPAFKNDNKRIEKLLYGGSVTSSKKICKFSNKLKRLRTNGKMIMEEQKRMQKASQDVNIIPGVELPSTSTTVTSPNESNSCMPSTSAIVTTENDEQQMEPTSSQIPNHRADDMDNCKKSYNRYATKPLSIKSQAQLLQNVKDYNNTINKDEPVKSVVSITQKNNKFKVSTINYQRIVNIGFATMPKGKVYKCFMINCAFQSYDKEIFRRHIIVFHDTDFEIKLVDACGICKTGKTLETLDEEFNHMLKCHIIDEVNSKTVEPDLVPSKLEQVLKSVVKVPDSNDKTSEEIVVINLIDEIQESSNVTLTLPDTISKIVDDTDVQELQDANKNDEVESTTVETVESTTVEAVEKTIEEQLHILNSVDDLSRKNKVRCVLCVRASKFDLIKCTGCEKWVHKDCKEDNESNIWNCKNCIDNNKSNVDEEVVEGQTELSTDDLWEILSPRIEPEVQDVPDKLSEVNTTIEPEVLVNAIVETQIAAVNTSSRIHRSSIEVNTTIEPEVLVNAIVETQIATVNTSSRPHRKRKQVFPYFEKDSSLSEDIMEPTSTKNSESSSSLDEPRSTRSCTKSTAAKHIKTTSTLDEPISTRSCTKSNSSKNKQQLKSSRSCRKSYSSEDEQYLNSFRASTKSNSSRLNTSARYRTRSRSRMIETKEKQSVLAVIDTRRMRACLIEKILPKLRNVKENNEITTGEVESRDENETEVDDSSNEDDSNTEDSVDLNAKNKVDLNSKQPEPDSSDAFPMEKVFQLIKKVPTKITFVNFSAMQPWERPRFNLKSKVACATMLEKGALISTFKCMSKMCCYCTSNEELFYQHLTLHSQNKRDLLFDFFRFCSYCSYVALNANSLIKHVKEMHCFNQYQCPFCFYRCLEAQSCSVHVQSYHNDKPLIFYECPVKADKYDVSKLNIRLLENREIYVLPVSCNACEKSFYTFKKYTDHMSNHAHEESNNKEIQDKVCVDMGKLHGLIENKKFGLYHCLFCLFGSDIKDDLQKHLSIKHPCEPVYICERTSADPRSFQDEKLYLATKIYHLNYKCVMPIEKINVDQ